MVAETNDIECLDNGKCFNSFLRLILSSQNSNNLQYWDHQYEKITL
jgi:hypothetical protein